jgi:hypothetical protein
MPVVDTLPLLAGELSGKVEEQSRRISAVEKSVTEHRAESAKALGDLRAENAADHAAVMAEIRGLSAEVRASLSTKADEAEVDKRLDPLERDFSGREHFDSTLRDVAPWAVGVLGILGAIGAALIH